MLKTYPVRFLALTALLGAVAPACGGGTDSVAPPPVGDDDAVTDDSMTDTDGMMEPETTPCDGMVVPMTDPTTLPANHQVCQYYCAPSEKISDFSVWNGGNWGDSQSLQGSSFTYTNTGVTPAEANPTVEVDTAAGRAHITASVNGYAGFGLAFGPCTNASRFSGVRVVMGGTMGEGGQLQFQVQTNNNYPITPADQRGACPGMWSDGSCASNYYNIDQLPAEPMEFLLPWADITGGHPEATVKPAELGGLQWQFNCASGLCAVDLWIDDVSFY